MSYLNRTSGSRFRHDPASQGIFIHGGTSLMHGPRESLGNPQPNHFTITWPIIAGTYPFAVTSSYPPCRTFGEAVTLAEKVREAHPVIHHAPIFACTDLIKDKPWSGKYAIQLVSHRLAKAVSFVAHHRKNTAKAA